MKDNYEFARKHLFIVMILAFAARFITSFSVQDEGQACYDMAKAMPALTTLTGSSSMLVCFFEYNNGDFIYSRLVSRMAQYCSSTIAHAYNALLFMTGSTGKTAWHTWPHRRNLIEAQRNSTTKFDAADLKDALQLELTSIRTLSLPAWCLFVRMIEFYVECWHN